MKKLFLLLLLSTLALSTEMLWYHNNGTSYGTHLSSISVSGKKSDTTCIKGAKYMHVPETGYSIIIYQETNEKISLFEALFPEKIELKREEKNVYTGKAKYNNDSYKIALKKCFDSSIYLEITKETNNNQVGIIHSYSRIMYYEFMGYLDENTEENIKKSVEDQLSKTFFKAGEKK